MLYISSYTLDIFIGVKKINEIHVKKWKSDFKNNDILLIAKIHDGNNCDEGGNHKDVNDEKHN